MTNYGTSHKKLKILKNEKTDFADYEIHSEWLEIFNKSFTGCQVVCRENEEDVYIIFFLFVIRF